MGMVMRNAAAFGVDAVLFDPSHVTLSTEEL